MFRNTFTLASLEAVFTTKYLSFLQTYSHEVYFDRDTIIHIEQERNNSYCCHVYKMTRRTNWWPCEHTNTEHEQLWTRSLRYPILVLFLLLLLFHRLKASLCWCHFKNFCSSWVVVTSQCLLWNVTFFLCVCVFLFFFLTRFSDNKSALEYKCWCIRDAVTS